MNKFSIEFGIWNLLFISALCRSVIAVTDSEAKQIFSQTLIECTQTHPVDMTDLLQLQTHVVPKKTEVKCLLACTYRKLGSMDKNGMYNVTKAYEIAKEMGEGDEKRLENAKKMADICAKVNDHAVTDGDHGCQRAALLFKCTVETAPKLGFKID